MRATDLCTSARYSLRVWPASNRRATSDRCRSSGRSSSFVSHRSLRASNLQCPSRQRFCWRSRSRYFPLTGKWQLALSDPSRKPAHDSRPNWFARPCSYGSFIRYLPPAFTGAFPDTFSLFLRQQNRPFCLLFTPSPWDDGPPHISNAFDRKPPRRAARPTP